MKVHSQVGIVAFSLVGAVLLALPVTARAQGTSACQDRVTSGGWINGTPSGGFANFSAAGGTIQGSLVGSLTYVDADAGLEVESTAVTDYTVLDSSCRQITYDVTINGDPGFTAVVTVCDNGEPGTNDTFRIELSNGYSAGGDLASGQPGGGDIQLHVTDCP